MHAVIVITGHSGHMATTVKYLSDGWIHRRVGWKMLWWVVEWTSQLRLTWWELPRPLLTPGTQRILRSTSPGASQHGLHWILGAPHSSSSALLDGSHPGPHWPQVNHKYRGLPHLMAAIMAHGTRRISRSTSPGGSHHGPHWIPSTPYIVPGLPYPMGATVGPTDSRYTTQFQVCLTW